MEFILAEELSVLSAKSVVKCLQCEVSASRVCVRAFYAFFTSIFAANYSLRGVGG